MFSQKALHKCVGNPCAFVIRYLYTVDLLIANICCSFAESSQWTEREPVPRVPNILPGLPTEHLPRREILEQVSYYQTLITNSVVDPYWICIQELCGSGPLFPIRIQIYTCDMRYNTNTIQYNTVQNINSNYCRTRKIVQEQVSYYKKSITTRSR